MKQSINLIIAMLLLVLTACTASEGIPSENDEAANTSLPPVLNTLPPALSTADSPEPEEESPMSPTIEEPKLTSATNQEDSSEINSGSEAPAASVDLSQVTSKPPENTTPMVMPQPGVADQAEMIAHEASQDLARRLGIDVSEVLISNTDSQEWPDSGLGCPDPNINYLTVITPGYLIKFEAAGENYTYHTDQEGNFVLCGKDGRPVE